MPRIKNGFATRRRRNSVLKKAQGYRGSHSTLYKNAKQTLIKAGVYAFRDRRAKKRLFRGLWITRLTAACEARGMSYSRFVHGLKLANIILNRKMLSEVAIHDPKAFDKIVEIARKSATAAA